MAWNETIYSFGDVQTMHVILQGVARVFSSGLLSSASTIWLLGFLFTIITIVFPAATGGKVKGQMFILTILLLFGGVFNTGSITIKDIYTGTTSAPVTGIPLILVVPAGLASQISYELSANLESNISSTTHVPITRAGFAQPYKVLAAFRDGASNKKALGPLDKSIRYFMTDCVLIEDSFNPVTLANAVNPLTYITSLPVKGITMTFTDAFPLGFLNACPAAKAEIISAAASTIGTGTPWAQGLYAKKCLGCSTNGGAGASAALGDSIGMLNMAAQSAQDFMVMLATIPSIRDGVACQKKPDSQQCLLEAQLAVNAEDARIDSAAGMSMFSRMLNPTMNLIMIMFFAFSPMMLIVAAYSSNHAGKIYAGMLLFGVWTQSWMPVAVILNAVIELQTQNYMQLSFAHGVTMENYFDFYKMIGDQLSVASNMFSAIPMVTMALLSGSVFGFTQLADKFSGKDKFNEKNLSPDVIQNAPVSTHAGTSYTQAQDRQTIQSAPGTKGSGVAIGTNGSLSITKMDSAALQAAAVQQRTNQIAATAAFREVYGAAASSSDDKTVNQAYEVAKSALSEEAINASNGYAATIAQIVGMNDADQAALAKKLAISFAAGADESETDKVVDAAVAASDKKKKKIGHTSKSAIGYNASGTFSASRARNVQTGTAADQQVSSALASSYKRAKTNSSTFKQNASLSNKSGRTYTGTDSSEFGKAFAALEASTASLQTARLQTKQSAHTIQTDTNLAAAYAAARSGDLSEEAFIEMVRQKAGNEAFRKTGSEIDRQNAIKDFDSKLASRKEYHGGRFANWTGGGSALAVLAQVSGMRAVDDLTGSHSIESLEQNQAELETGRGLTPDEAGAIRQQTDESAVPVKQVTAAVSVPGIIKVAETKPLPAGGLRTISDPDKLFDTIRNDTLSQINKNIPDRDAIVREASNRMNQIQEGLVAIGKANNGSLVKDQIVGLMKKFGIDENGVVGQEILEQSNKIVPSDQAAPVSSQQQQQLFGLLSSKMIDTKSALMVADGATIREQTTQPLKPQETNQNQEIPVVNAPSKGVYNARVEEKKARLATSKQKTNTIPMVLPNGERNPNAFKNGVPLDNATLTVPVEHGGDGLPRTWKQMQQDVVDAQQMQTLVLEQGEAERQERIRDGRFKIAVATVAAVATVSGISAVAAASTAATTTGGVTAAGASGATATGAGTRFLGAIKSLMQKTPVKRAGVLAGAASGAAVLYDQVTGPNVQQMIVDINKLSNRSPERHMGSRAIPASTNISQPDLMLNRLNEESQAALALSTNKDKNAEEIARHFLDNALGAEPIQNPSSTNPLETDFAEMSHLPSAPAPAEPLAATPAAPAPAAPAPAAPAPVTRRKAVKKPNR